MASKITEVKVETWPDDITGWKYPSGFYYDDELHNPLTRVTLHANKQYVDTDKARKSLDGPWKQVSDGDGDGWGTGYSYIPIATSIFSEDFTFDIANTYSDFGGDPIGELWNSQNVTAPYSEMIAEALKTISAKTINWADQKEGTEGVRPKWADVVADIADTMSKVTEKNAKLHTRSLHLNGTQFSYYAGTGISFNNMSMKFTLLSDWEDGKFISAIDKLTKGDFPLMAYVIGDFIPVTEVGKEEGDVQKFLSKYASWQLPPGGFKANLINVDTANEGTLKLRFGPYFSISNLVISGCSISVSKNMIRNPQGKGNEDSPWIVPMSCDVTLQFKPAANFSKVTLEKVLKGQTNYIGEATKNFNLNV